MKIESLVKALTYIRHEQWRAKELLEKLKIKEEAVLEEIKAHQKKSDEPFEIMIIKVPRSYPD